MAGEKANLDGVYTLIEHTIDQWLVVHTKTKRKDVPGRLTANIIRELHNKGYVIHTI